MIGLPEARTLAKDLKRELRGKTIIAVRGNFEGHKFTFYSGAIKKENFLGSSFYYLHVCQK